MSGSTLKAGEDLRISDALVVEDKNGNLVGKEGGEVPVFSYSALKLEMKAGR